MEIKMAAQEMIARLKKYEPDNPNLTPGKNNDFWKKSKNIILNNLSAKMEEHG